VPTYLEYLLTTGRIAQAQALLDAPLDVRLNRDLAPISYFYDLAVWLSRFYGPFSQATAMASRLSLAWLAPPLLLAAVLLRRHAVPAAIGFIGLAEMALEVVILFSFQVVHGYVYGQVGLIVTAFMLGLALGGALTNRVKWSEAALSGESPEKTRLRRPRLSPRSALGSITVGITLLALGLPSLISLRPPAWAFPLLALAAGGLTGMAYPLAVACFPGDTERVAGLLYGADLVGGCLGAVLASVFLVPILGIPQTCMAIGLVGLGGLVALL
jgi:spermidine synthase